MPLLLILTKRKRKQTNKQQNFKKYIKLNFKIHCLLNTYNSVSANWSHKDKPQTPFWLPWEKTQHKTLLGLWVLSHQ